MIDLDNHLTLTPEVIKSPNLTSHFTDRDLSTIGNLIFEGYQRDKDSRQAWERRCEAAMDLAMQISKDKNFPWPGCANVSFPLITVAVLQFHSRAYPEIINGTDVVKCRTIGDDEDGSKSKKSDRISTHMSYQVLEEDRDWNKQHDKLLINLAVIGCTFIKTYYNNKHNVSEMVMAKDLVLNYWAKSVNECDRKTHVYTLSRNEIYERVLRGTFRDVLEESWYTGITPNNPNAQFNRDKQQGRNEPQEDETSPLWCLEQHVSLDLDGDGYSEPYIVTIDSNSKQVLRIVTRFDREVDIQRVQEGPRKGQIISITPTEYFTKYTFIPSPDGGIYDMGLGTLTGPLNESVNSLVNQLLDAGSMANGGGGFLGRGMKIRGGAYTFSPFEWKRVDSTGEDISKGIYPLPVREPSAVLFQLLGFIVDYTNRISGATEMMVGENPGQNTPAETSRTLVTQGEKVYSAIFKRVWESMREEFRKLYILNSLYLPMKQPFGHNGFFAMREDYLGDPDSVVPVADPSIVSEEQRVRQAMLLKQASMSTPGYNREEIEKRFLQALRVEGIALVFPGPDKVPPLPNPKVQVEELKLQARQMQMKADVLMFMTKLEEERRLNTARITELHAKAASEIASADGERAGTAIAALDATLGILKQHDESLARQMELAQKGIQYVQTNSPQGGVPGMAGAPSNPSPQGSPGPEEGGIAG